MVQRLLLDTQTAIWVLNSNKRLGRNAQRLILSAGEVGISAMSIAENEMKRMARGIGDGSLRDEFVANGYEVWDFSGDAALQISRFGSLVRHEPFDRMILAHAVATDSKLLTSDRVLLELGFDWVIDSTL